MNKTHMLNTRNNLLNTLPLPHLRNNLSRPRGRIQRRPARQDLPMIKDRLREGLAASGAAQVRSEAERLVDRQVRFDIEQRGARSLLLGEHVTAAPGEDAVDAAHGLFGDLDLDLEDGFENAWVSEEGGSVEDAAGGGDELAAAAMDGVGV